MNSEHNNKMKYHKRSLYNTCRLPSVASHTESHTSRRRMRFLIAALPLTYALTVDEIS
jgi:hypothetical protein